MITKVVCSYRLLIAALLVGVGGAVTRCQSQVLISEFLAANANDLRDEDGERQDWIELQNQGLSRVNLAGWSLTDDRGDRAKWIFPDVTIKPGGFMVLFCSGKDRRLVDGGELHTNFRLEGDGEYLGFYNNAIPSQAVSVLNPFPQQRSDYSYGLTESSEWRYFASTTPGETNGSSSIIAIVADTKFSHDRGFYDSPFSLIITSATPGVEIRYTLDGRPPSPTNGLVYSAPISVEQTTVVRAAGYKGGLLETDVDCHTYLFLDDVIVQSPDGSPPPGWPANWGGNVRDYGMDPDIVEHPAYRDEIVAGLKSIPSISIVMRLEDLFDNSTGIYAHAMGRGIAWERPCSLELIHPGQRDGFQVNAGIRIRGGLSRALTNPKHAFRIFFRREHGAPRLNFPFFGPEGADSFDKFDLRCSSARAWSRTAEGGLALFCTFMRDPFSRQLQLAMDRPAKRGDFYHLYINGTYWGLYDSDERADAAWAESYIGGREDDYDTIKVERSTFTVEATTGTTDAWFRLWQAATNGLAADADYFRIQGLHPDGSLNPAFENLLDVPNLIDYMLLILFSGNNDAPISQLLLPPNSRINNWYAVRNLDNLHGGFRFLAHDSEFTFYEVNTDRTGPFSAGDPAQGSDFGNSNPQYLWQQLQANSEFRLLVADHVQRHFFHGGVFTAGSAGDRWLSLSNEIYLAVIAESARWGDAKVHPPRTRGETWITAVRSGFDIVNARSQIVLDQLRADGLYPGLAAPALSQRGGLFPSGFHLVMTNENGSGSIIYTLDGSDPRRIGGIVDPGAKVYDEPVSLSAPTWLKARVYDGVEWSALSEAVFYPQQDLTGLRITEIMYHPLGDDTVDENDLEYIELKNSGTNTIDLGGLRFSEGIKFVFTNNTFLAPGEFIVLGRDPDLLQARYPGLVIGGVYLGKLANEGERISLTHVTGSQVLSVEYNDGGRWAVTPDGHGYSLVPRMVAGDLRSDEPGYWGSSASRGGSPGGDDPEATVPPIVISELLTHSGSSGADAIEVFNPTSADVDLGGWLLTDDRSILGKFVVPENTIVPAGGYWVFEEHQFNSLPGSSNSFELDEGGGEVHLISADTVGNLTGYSYSWRFGPALPGVSFGRQVLSTGEEHIVARDAVTLGRHNAGPLVGPVVVSQIMYHPPDLPDGSDNVWAEYIELWNTGTEDVPLYDPIRSTNTWRLRDAVVFAFPVGRVLPAGERILVVSFAPSDASEAEAFAFRYPLLSGIPMCGPYQGKLNNAEDSVELVRPGEPDADGVSEILVERVHYRDEAPWPPQADGTGAALHRELVAGYGNEPVNWNAEMPLSFVSQLTDVSVTPGSDVTLSPSVRGALPLQFQWRRDGWVLPGATDSTLTLTNVQEADQGEYTVVVIDASGMAQGRPGFMTVLIEPYVILAPQSQAVPEGGSVTFSIEAGGALPMGFRWRRGGSTMANFVLRSPISFFTISSAQVSDEGRYAVVLTNAALPTPGRLSPTANLTVLSDADGDGMHDLWETTHGLDLNDPTDASLDLDADGMSNGREFTAGTDPSDPLSSLRVDRLLANEFTEVWFEAVSNQTYTIEYTPNPGIAPWHRLEDLAGRPTNHTAGVRDHRDASRRFYRLVTPRRP